MIRVNAHVTPEFTFVSKAMCPMATLASSEIIHMVCQAQGERCPQYGGLDGRQVLCGGGRDSIRLDGQMSTPSVQVSVPSNKVEKKDVDLDLGDQGKAKGKVQKVNPDGTVEVQTQTPPNSNPNPTQVVADAGQLRQLMDQYSRYPDIDALIQGVMGILEQNNVPLGQQVMIERDLENAGMDVNQVRAILQRVMQLTRGTPSLV